jgi:muconate cycloisomerase
VRITRVEATTVSIPYRFHWRNHHTEQLGQGAMTQRVTTVLEVATDSGVHGIGEVPGGAEARAAIDAMRPHVLGEDPLAIDALLEHVAAGAGQNAAIAGLDFALHDILGKALGAPLYQILGGKYRESMPLVWTLGIKELPQRVAEAKDAVAQGFRHAVKLKVGVASDVEHVVTISHAIDPVPIRPDSNMGHSKAEALTMLRQMKAQGVHFEVVEAPCPTDFAAFDEIAGEIGVGIGVHEACRTEDNLQALLRSNCRAIVYANLDPFTWGVRGTIRAAQALESVGIACTMGTSHASGIKSAVETHLGVALRNMRYPADILGPLILEDDLLAEPIDMADGDARPSDRPGLGVELDRAAVERYERAAAAGVGGVSVD